MARRAESEGNELPPEIHDLLSAIAVGLDELVDGVEKK